MSQVFDETWFYATVETEGEVAPLSDDEAHHALRVLRLDPGVEIVVSNGVGSVFRAALEVSGKRAEIRVLHRIAHEPEPPRISLALGLLKGRDIELPVEAACEFPIRDVFLLRTDHSSEFKGQDFERLLERLRSKSAMALKQAKKAWLTRIHAPLDLRAWREQYRRIALAVAHPGLDTVPASLPKELHALVGPEGGFSPGELEYLFAQENVYRLALGSTRLRAMHAPMAALGNLSARSGGLG